MAFGARGLDVTYRCVTDLSTKQYYAVSISANHTVGLAGDAGKVIGILQNKPNGTVGESAVVRISGLSKCVVGYAASTQHLLTSDAAGKGVRTAAADEWIFGVVTDSGDNTVADGDIITVQIMQGKANAADA